MSNLSNALREHAAGNVAKALSIYRTLGKTYLGNPEFTFWFALAECEVGDPKKGFELLKSLLKHNFRPHEALKNLTKVSVERLSPNELLQTISLFYSTGEYDSFSEDNFLTLLFGLASVNNHSAEKLLFALNQCKIGDQWLLGGPKIGSLLELLRGSTQKAPECLSLTLLIYLANTMRLVGHAKAAISILESRDFYQDYWCCVTLGNLYRDVGNAKRAFEVFNRAQELSSSSVEASLGVANALIDDERWSEAESHLEKLLHQPGLYDEQIIEINLSLSIALLMQGRLLEGFRCYESRLKKGVKVSGKYLPDIHESGLMTRADLESGGGEIHIVGEQGVGDQVLFSTVVPEVAKRFKKVFLYVDTRLQKILHFDEKNILIKNFADLPKVKHKPMIAMGSLPLYFRKSVSDFEVASGFRIAPSKVKLALAEKVISRLRENHELIIGTVASSSNTVLKALKSFDVSSLENGIKKIYPSALFVPLQKGLAVRSSGSESLNLIAKNFNFHEDLDGLAAFSSKCDLVIGVGNTEAHVIAASNPETLVVISKFGSRFHYWKPFNEWSLWYPGISIVRQSREESNQFFTQKLIDLCLKKIHSPKPLKLFLCASHQTSAISDC